MKQVGVKTEGKKKKGGVPPGSVSVALCRIVVIFMLVTSLSLAFSVNSAAAESITVYVKDQKGDNVYNNPDMAEDTNLLIELYYEGNLLEEKSRYFDGTSDHVTIPVDHTGLYTVRAIATLEFQDDSVCYVGRLGYGLSPDIPECKEICSGHVFIENFIDEYEPCIISKDKRGDGTNEKGNYRCEDFSCFRTSSQTDEPGQATADGAICDFKQTYRYVEMNEVLTYVDRYEWADEAQDDEAQVTVLTKRELLEKYGREMINLRESTLGVEPSTSNSMDDLKITVAPEAIGVAIDQGIEQSDALKNIFGSGFKKALVAEGGATLIILGAEAVYDPDSIKENSRNWGYITTGVVASFAGETLLKGLLFGSATIGAGATFGIGVAVAIPVGMALDYTMRQDHEANMCEHAVTDDLDIFIKLTDEECDLFGPHRSGDDQFWECEKYKLSFVNKGEKMSEVGVGQDADLPLTSCEAGMHHYFNGNEFCIASDRLDNGEIIEYTVDFDYYIPDIYKRFTTDGRLYHKIEVLPGLTCNFDTKDIPVINSLDYPPLGELQKHAPYIGNIEFPELIYSDDDFNVSAFMVDDKGITNAIINWSYIGERDNQEGSNSMQKISGTDMYSTWQGTSDKLLGYGEGDVSFSIIANDGENEPVENDNDQIYYHIQVVEDADSGGDAPIENDYALNITDHTVTGDGINGFLVCRPDLGYYDCTDTYKFNVEAGQKIDLYFKSEKFSKFFLILYVEEQYSTSTSMDSQGGILNMICGLTAAETGYGYIAITYPYYDDYVSEYEFSVEVYGDPYPVDPTNLGTDEKESITVPDVTLTAVGDKPVIPRKAIIKQIAGKEVNPDETLNIFEDDLGTINSPSCNLGDSKLLYLALDKTYLNYEPGMDPNNIIDPKPWSCRRELDENGQEVGYSCCYVPTDDDLVYGCEEHTLFAEIDAEGNEIGDLVIENYVDDIGVDWRYFVIYTTGNNELKITTAPTYYEGSANFLDLYVGCGYYPDEYDYDYASQGPDANEEIIISNPGWAFYYIGVSPNTDWGWYTINITLDGVEQPLQVNIDDWFNEFHDYLITTPPNAAAIKIETKDVEYRGTDFLDLYARYDNFASPDYYDFASKSASANELITIINPKSGNYYIGVDSKNDDWGLYGLSAKPGYKWWNCSYGNPDYSVFWVPASNLENNKDYHIFITSGYPYPPPNPTNKESKNITIHVTRDMAPEVGSINAEVRFNRVFISVTASDENNNLDYVDIYANGGQIASGDISGGTYTYEWDTSNLQDRDTYVANATVFDARGNWATTNDIAVEVRVDSEAPNISALVAVDTPQGVVVGGNVSGFLLLSLSVSDDKSGIDSINVSLKNTETTTEGGYTIQAESNPSETLTTRGLTNILSKFRDDGVKTFSDGGESEPTVDETGGLIYWNTTELNGEQTILVNATDNLGNTAVKEFTFNVDNTPPTINSVKPSDNAILEGIEDLEVNASDDNVGVYDAEWFLDLAGKQLKIGSGTKTMWGSSGLDGSYTLTVNVSDVVGNMQSVDVPVTIRSPDLSINESEVVVTDNNITAVIHNLGSADAQNVNVSFYSGNESFASEIINVSAGGSEVVVVNYTPTEKDITVVADQYDWITEIDEWNNYVVIEAQSSDFDHDGDGIVRGDLDDLRSQYNAYIGIIVGDESEYDHNGNGVVRGDLDDLRRQYNAYIGLGGV